MAAYLIADLTVHDPVGVEEYRQRVPAVIAQFGGRYLVRGGAMEVLEGKREPSRIIILEFPDMAALKQFYHSPEYAELIPLRQKTCTTDVLIVEGIEG
ncbi:MAG: DUF1330 domain-containing protein [Alphaproteobacteria bacterium]